MPGADDVDDVRERISETLDALETRVDVGRIWHDVQRRVRSRADEQPIPVAAIAVAGLAVAALGVVIVYRIVRH
jgi:hypothetical protein